jgi:hypothetical protein
MSSDVQHTQDGFRLRNIFGHLNRTWEALRMEGADSPIRNNLNRLYKELSATAEHLLKDRTNLATFGRKCAELAAGLQWVIVHHFVPAQLLEKLEDLAAEFRISNICMENRLDDLEQRLHRLNRNNDEVPLLQRRTDRLRSDICEFQDALHAREAEIADLRASVDEGLNLVTPRRRREDSRHTDDSRESCLRRCDSVDSRHHHRNESREPRQRHRDETPRPRRMIEFSPPPRFSGTEKKVLFTNWWRHVMQFLDNQPPGAIGDDKRKISWVSTRLEAEAEMWYWDWKKQAEKPFSTVEFRWERFQADIKKRFTDVREDVGAWKDLRKMTYSDDIHSFMTKWDGLCVKAGVHGTVYRDMLLRAVGPAIRAKMENVAPAHTNEGLQEQVLNAGGIVEL